MTGSSTAMWLLLAQQEAAPAAQPSLLSYLPLFMILMLLWIFVIQRPQRREQQAREQLLKNLKKNDKVLLNSGIYGVVTNVQQDSDDVTIRVDETSNTKLRVLRSAIARVLVDESAAKKEGEPVS